MESTIRISGQQSLTPTKMIGIELLTDCIGSECKYHDCTNSPTELWQGISTEEMEYGIEASAWLLVYCNTHVENHAKPQDNTRCVGKLTGEPNVIEK